MTARAFGSVALLFALVGYGLLSWIPIWTVAHSLTRIPYMALVWLCFWVALAANCLGHVFTRETPMPGSGLAPRLFSRLTLHLALTFLIPLGIAGLVIWRILR